MSEDEKRARIAAFKAVLEQEIRDAERLRDEAIEAKLPSDDTDIFAKITIKRANIEVREDELRRLRRVYNNSFPSEETLYARADAYFRRKEMPLH